MAALHRHGCHWGLSVGAPRRLARGAGRAPPQSDHRPFPAQRRPCPVLPSVALHRHGCSPAYAVSRPRDSTFASEKYASPVHGSNCEGPGAVRHASIVAQWPSLRAQGALRCNTRRALSLRARMVLQVEACKNHITSHAEAHRGSPELWTLSLRARMVLQVEACKNHVTSHDARSPCTRGSVHRSRLSVCAQPCVGVEPCVSGLHTCQAACAAALVKLMAPRLPWMPRYSSHAICRQDSEAAHRGAVLGLCTHTIALEAWPR
jgi:hypothetical protein